MIALLAVVVLVAIVLFFGLAHVVWQYWYIVFPIGFLIWFWLLAFELKDDAPALEAKARRLKYRVCRRDRPSWIRWLEVKRGARGSEAQ